MNPDKAILTFIPSAGLALFLYLAEALALISFNILLDVNAPESMLAFYLQLLIIWYVSYKLDIDLVDDVIKWLEL